MDDGLRTIASGITRLVHEWRAEGRRVESPDTVIADLYDYILVLESRDLVTAMHRFGQSLTEATEAARELEAARNTQTTDQESH